MPTTATHRDLEKKALTLGFVPLTDCAPLVMALELGIFARHGLDVRLSREASWSNIRDKVAVGVLDGAQMLAALPLAATAGIGSFPTPMISAMALGLNGNAITLSQELWSAMAEVAPELMGEPRTRILALKRLLDISPRPLVFGVVFALSSHAYQLRAWLNSAGIDPDRDVRLEIIPPPHMAERLKAGALDGYCVGEPWNTASAAAGIGRVAITGYELWNNAPEKVLGVTAAWAAAHPNTLTALISALIETARWLDQPDNRVEASRILARPEYVGEAESVLRPALAGVVDDGGGERRAVPDFVVFHRYAATFPWVSHGLWFLREMVRWGQLRLDGDAPDGDLESIAAAVCRTDLYRLAAARVGEPVPRIDSKREGRHEGAWTLMEASQPMAMGADRFFDGRAFDPADPSGHLRDLATARSGPHDLGKDH